VGHRQLAKDAPPVLGSSASEITRPGEGGKPSMISWSTVFLGAPLYQYVTAVAAGVIFYLLLRSLVWLLRKRIKKFALQPEFNTNALVKNLLDHTSMLFLLWMSVYIGLRFLDFVPSVLAIIQTITIIALLVQIGFWSIELIEYWVTRQQLGKGGKLKDRKGAVLAISFISKLVVWAVVIVLVLENIPGIQITTLIASLGIGGIAIGLALQKILGDLFASLTISIDQPFVEGDAINIGDFSGTVEHIGLKSTRLRSFTGEQVIFSNSDLLASRIRNYQSMEHRMIVFPLNVTYQTSLENLQKIPQLVKDIIEAQEKVTFNRAHLKSYSDSAIVFEVVYTINTADFTLYMDIQQNINLQIFQKFLSLDIHFAYPTQTVLLHNT
jgi:small-conductance mechanosensitive channel